MKSDEALRNGNLSEEDKLELIGLLPDEELRTAEIHQLLKGYGLTYHQVRTLTASVYMERIHKGLYRKKDMSELVKTGKEQAYAYLDRMDPADIVSYLREKGYEVTCTYTKIVEL